MYAALQSVLQSILVFMGRAIGSLFLSVSVSGLEHIPRSEALILVSNHFSWFDGPLLMIFMPVRIVFLLAIETERVCFFRFLSRTFNLIPIWRGQVDRKAMRAALAALKEGRTVGVFPEGGIDPAMARADRADSGPYGPSQRQVDPRAGRDWLAGVTSADSAAAGGRAWLREDSGQLKAVAPDAGENPRRPSLWPPDYPR